VLFGRETAIGRLDNCNFHWCTSNTDDEPLYIIQTLAACIPMTKTCGYGDWTMQHCFKFLNAEGRKCTCEHGDIMCEIGG
jgi:hypothetical protein